MTASHDRGRNDLNRISQSRHGIASLSGRLFKVAAHRVPRRAGDPSAIHEDLAVAGDGGRLRAAASEAHVDGIASRVGVAPGGELRSHLGDGQDKPCRPLDGVYALARSA